MPRLPDLRPAAIAHLLLPLGTLLQLGLSPLDLAVSGLRQTSLLPSLLLPFFDFFSIYSPMYAIGSLLSMSTADLSASTRSFSTPCSRM